MTCHTERKGTYYLSLKVHTIQYMIKCSCQLFARDFHNLHTLASRTANGLALHGPTGSPEPSFVEYVTV